MVFRSAIGCLLAWPGVVLAQAGSSVSPAARDANGFLVHEVHSPFQAGTTQIKVLLPDARRDGERFPVVYVLPVEAQNGSHYGDGLLEIKRHNVANKRRTIFVAPTFSHLPWYADYPTDPEIRQESYLLKVVLPYIEQTYPARAERDGRLLLGFSKSGWGAWSLLLRHPELFAKAAAWDAPLAMDQIGKYGTTEILATQQTFDAHKIVALLPKRRDDLKHSPRLILMGHGNFRDQTEAVHALLKRVGIPHEYRDGLVRKHDWHSGWVPEAVELLVPSTLDK